MASFNGLYLFITHYNDFSLMWFFKSFVKYHVVSLKLTVIQFNLPCTLLVIPSRLTPYTVSFFKWPLFKVKLIMLENNLLIIFLFSSLVRYKLCFLAEVLR